MEKCENLHFPTKITVYCNTVQCYCNAIAMLFSHICYLKTVNSELFIKQNETKNVDLTHPNLLPYLNEPRCEKIGFLHMRKQRRRSATRIVQSLYFQIRNFKLLAIFAGCTAWFVSDLVENPEDRSSQNEAQMILPLDGFVHIRSKSYNQ